jgi:8-oxo-dGTP pyrophosphatase MutT (NUDIX family)
MDLEIELALSRYSFQQISSKSAKKSAVALIVRKSVVNDDLEILFVKRTTRPGSNRWNGHVAFPGGHVDPVDLDERAAAVREAQEEVGINLNSRDFRYVGRLSSYWARYQLLTTSAFVFFQIVTVTPPLTLQASEIAGRRWVSIKCLTHEHGKHDDYSMNVFDSVNPEHPPKFFDHLFVSSLSNYRFVV